MENIFERALGNITGGRLLDVATGEGGFIHLLIEYLKSYTQIVGIDSSSQNIEAARNNFPQKNIRFMRMDAEQLEFHDQHFDTVSLSASNDSHSSPYIGDRMVTLFCDNLKRYVAGDPLQHVCDPEKGY